MILAAVADALQIIIFPVFVEGAASPADDVLDVAVAAVMVHLLGWHWEFLPTVVAKLVPGVDLVPFWTLAVANVYRKWKQSMSQKGFGRASGAKEPNQSLANAPCRRHSADEIAAENGRT